MMKFSDIATAQELGDELEILIRSQKQLESSAASDLYCVLLNEGDDNLGTEIYIGGNAVLIGVKERISELQKKLSALNVVYDGPPE